MQTFGSRLRTLLESFNIEGKDFAAVIGVSPPTVSNWLNGKRFPKDEMLIRVANHFHVSLDFLLGRTDSPVEYPVMKVSEGNLSIRKMLRPHEPVSQDYSHIINALMPGFLSNKDDSISSFASRLGLLLESRGIETDELSTALNTPKIEIDSWLNGSASPTDDLVLKFLASYFGVTPDYLMGRTPDESGIMPANPLFDDANIAIKEIIDVKNILRERLIKAGKIKEGDPLPPSYLKKFIEKAIKLQEAADTLSDD